MKKIVATMMLSAIALNLFSNLNMVQAEESEVPTSESSTFYSPSEAGKVLDEKKNEDLIKDHSKLSESENFEFGTSLGTLSDLIGKYGNDLSKLLVYPESKELLLESKKIYDKTFEKHAVTLTKEREVYFSCNYKDFFGSQAMQLKKDGKFDKDTISREVKIMNPFYVNQYKPVGQLENDNSDVAITYTIPRHTKVLLYKNIEGKNMIVADIKKGLKIVKSDVIHRGGKEAVHFRAKLIEVDEYSQERTNLIGLLSNNLKEIAGIPNTKLLYFDFSLNRSVNDKAFRDLYFNGINNQRVEHLIKNIFQSDKDETGIAPLTFLSANPVFHKYFDNSLGWTDSGEKATFKSTHTNTPILMVRDENNQNRMLVNINSQFWKSDGGEAAFLYWLSEHSINHPESVGLSNDFTQKKEFISAVTEELDQNDKSLHYKNLPDLFELDENDVKKTISDKIELYRAAFVYYYHSDLEAKKYLRNSAPDLYDLLEFHFEESEA